MAKKAIILISFLGYVLTLMHSFVPHHHHEKSQGTHSHSHAQEDHHHHDDEGENPIARALADVIHFPGSEIMIQSAPVQLTQELASHAEPPVHDLTRWLAPQLKPPDLNCDLRKDLFTSCCCQHFLLRAPPLA